VYEFKSSKVKASYICSIATLIPGQSYSLVRVPRFRLAVLHPLGFVGRPAFFLCPGVKPVQHHLFCAVPLLCCY
jgi:hypothetical protein